MLGYKIGITTGLSLPLLAHGRTIGPVAMISAANDGGEGATFMVELPRVTAGQDAGSRGA
jgi:hypothetical protein